MRFEPKDKPSTTSVFQPDMEKSEDSITDDEEKTKQKGKGTPDGKANHDGSSSKNIFFSKRRSEKRSGGVKKDK